MNGPHVQMLSFSEVDSVIILANAYILLILRGNGMRYDEIWW